jgi:hypothetical protein
MRDDPPMAEGDWPTLRPGVSVVVVNPLRSYWSLKLCSEAALTARSSGATVYWLDVPTSLRFRIANGLELNAADRYKLLAYNDPSKVTSAVLQREGVVPLKLEVHRPHKLQDWPESLTALRNWRWEGAPLGRAVHASISGQMFRRYLDMTSPPTTRRVRSQLRTAVGLYKGLLSLLEQLRPQFIITTNDRALPSAVALMAARMLDVGSLVAYWGSQVDTWITYATSLYSQEDRARHCQQSWQEVQHAPELLRDSVAESEAWMNSHAELPTTRNFTEHMTPDGIPPKRRRYRATFFASSLWEFSGLEEFPAGNFADQHTAFSSILRSLPSAEWEVFLRHHPRHPDLGDVSEAASWTETTGREALCVISPESTVDSMELARTSELNFVWNSSIGLRLLAEGIPVHVTGPAFWNFLGLGVSCRSKSEIPTFAPSDAHPAANADLLAVLHYLRSHGGPYRFATGLGSDLCVNGSPVFTLRTGAGTVRRLLSAHLR